MNITTQYMSSIGNELLSVYRTFQYTEHPLVPGGHYNMYVRTCWLPAGEFWCTLALETGTEGGEQNGGSVMGVPAAEVLS